MNAVSAAMFLATLLSGGLIIWSVRFSIASIKALSSQGTRFFPVVTWTFVTCCFPIFWFVAVTVGGNFGGAIFSRLAESSGFADKVFVPIGIGVGMLLTLTGLSCAAILLAYGLAFTLIKMRRDFGK